MKILYSQLFLKHYENLPVKIKLKLTEKIDLLLADPFNITLKNHALKGRLAGFRAISVTGNYRIIYKYELKDFIKLIDIGTHNQVY